MTEILENPELRMLLNNKEAGFNYREPRHEAWRENYELYRDHVTINRLTQRQSVNLPLMKTTLRTLLKDIDDMPVIEFENLDNDKQAEVFQNEYWKKTLEWNNAEIQDIVDKKQDFFFGRTLDEWQIADGKIKFDIVDPEDIYVDRFMNPYDIDSSTFLIHTHIFKPLSTLKENPDYDQKEVAKLEDYFKSKQGIVKAIDNENSLQQKNKKMSEMGVSDIEDPVLGETYVELTYHYVFRSDYKKNGKELPRQIIVYVEAEDQTILMKKPQEEIIGTTKDNFWQNHFRYNTWGDDIDKQDFWTDGIADVVRVPNKVLNSFISQLVENRTLRNFGMHYYDASLKAEGFNPSTWQPMPFGWYGVPLGGRNINEVFQKVEIPDLSESLDEMAYLTEMVNNATGATASKQGAVTQGTKTKYEINAVLGEATERTQGLSKFYTKAWERRGLIFLKLIEAGADKLDAVKIYKKGKNTDNVFEREIGPKDWITEAGYQVKVWSQDEKKSKDTERLTKLNSVKLAMPDNPKLAEIYNRKLLEFGELTPDEITEVMDYETKKLTMGVPPTNMNAGVSGQATSAQMPTAMPMQPTA